MDHPYVEKSGYPMTPKDAAAKIVADLLPDLPITRQEAVRDAIEAWGGDWGDSICGTALESMRG